MWLTRLRQIRFNLSLSCPRSNFSYLHFDVPVRLAQSFFSVLFSVLLRPDCNFNLLWLNELFGPDSNVERSTRMSRMEPTNFNSIYCYRHCACSPLPYTVGSIYSISGIWSENTHARTHTHMRFYNNLSRFSRLARSLGSECILIWRQTLYTKGPLGRHITSCMSHSPFFPPLLTAEPWVRDPLCEWHTRAVLTGAVIHSAVCLQRCCCMELHIAQVTKDGGAEIEMHRDPQGWMKWMTGTGQEWTECRKEANCAESIHSS